MRVLVVAGTGFLGGHVVRAFLDRGDHVTTIVRDAARAKADGRLIGAELAVGRAGALPQLDRHDVVVYAAGVSGRGASEQEIATRCEEVYVDGVRALAGRAADWGAHFVFLSGVSRFGTYPGRTRVHEDSPPGMLCVFGSHKRKGEAVLAAIPGLRWTALIPLELYGARASTGTLPFIHDRMRARRFFLLGDGTNRWSMCNVDNAVAAIVAIAPGQGHGPLLIADKEPTSQRELATAGLGRARPFPRSFSRFRVGWPWALPPSPRAFRARSLT